MRIAQIAPIWHKIPPKLYGGTERIVSLVTEGLVRRGHEVTLFATGDSRTSAKLVPVVPRGLYNGGFAWWNVTYPLYHITNVYDQASKFDIIHMHLNFASDYLAFPLAHRTQTPSIFTVHFRFKSEEEDKLKGTRKVLLKYKHLNFVSISNSQRTIPLNFVRTVYNAVPIEKYPFKDRPEGGYLLWVGRVAEDKGTAEAIEVARLARKKLILAGKIDAHDKTLQDYYKRKVEPYIDNKNVVFVGELARQELVKLYQNAQALIFPLKWDEPFGLVMIEAMAAGTPIIAYARGSVPEVVKDGETGFIVKTTEKVEKSQVEYEHLNTVIDKCDIYGLVEAVKRIAEINRAACRRHVEDNFTDDNMVKEYEKAYQKVIDKS